MLYQLLLHSCRNFVQYSISNLSVRHSCIDFMKKLTTNIDYVIKLTAYYNLDYSVKLLDLCVKYSFTGVYNVENRWRTSYTFFNNLCSTEISQNKINGLPGYSQNVHNVNLHVFGINVFYLIDCLFHFFKIVRTVLNVKV